MPSSRHLRILWLLVSLSAAAPVWGSSIDIICPSHGPAGGSMSCALDLLLTAGVTMDSLTFGVIVTPNGSAPALTAGVLTFTDAIGGAFINTAGIGHNAIDALWAGLSPALSGSPHLGTVGFFLPLSATNGAAYSVIISGASGALGEIIVPLTIGPANTVSATVPDPATGGMVALGLLAVANHMASKHKSNRRCHRQSGDRGTSQ